MVDYVPRELSQDQKDALSTLSRVVVNLFKQRRLLAVLMPGAN